MKDHNPSPITRQATGVAAKGGELEALLARVEAATGPDQRDLLLAAGEYLVPYGQQEDGGYAWWSRFIGYIDAGAFTDAALALTEKVLPEWRPFIQNRGVIPDHQWLTRLQWWEKREWAWGRTAPLSVIAALLKALSHQPPRAPDEPGDRAREETKS